MEDLNIATVNDSGKDPDLADFTSTQPKLAICHFFQERGHLYARNNAYSWRVVLRRSSETVIDQHRKHQAVYFFILMGSTAKRIHSALCILSSVSHG